MKRLKSFRGRFLDAVPVFGSGNGLRPLNGPPAKIFGFFFLSSAVRSCST